MSGLEWLAAVISALGVWLTGRRTVWCWPVMLLASVLYGVVFAQDHLYADAALQAVFAALALYGLWCWLRGVQENGQVHIVTTTAQTLLRDTAITAVAGLAVGVALRNITDDPMPLSDAGLSAYSVLGQIWIAKRYRACWVLWIVVDVLYTLLFVQRRLFVTAVLYAAFVGLAIQGWRQWRDEVVEHTP